MPPPGPPAPIFLHSSPACPPFGAANSPAPGGTGPQGPPGAPQRPRLPRRPAPRRVTVEPRADSALHPRRLRRWTRSHLPVSRASCSAPAYLPPWPHRDHTGLAPCLVLSQPCDEDVQPQQRRPEAVPLASRLCCSLSHQKEMVSPLPCWPWCCFSWHYLSGQERFW